MNRRKFVERTASTILTGFLAGNISALSSIDHTSVNDPNYQQFDDLRHQMLAMNHPTNTHVVDHYLKPMGKITECQTGSNWHFSFINPFGHKISVQLTENGQKLYRIQ